MNQKDYSFIWMPLIGFDKDAEDKGVQSFIENASFIPKGVSVFLFHSDIVNEHGDRGEEFILHPDNCSYYGAPCNTIRQRQDWTNKDLKILGDKLKEQNIETFLGIMGVYLEDTRHDEWESKHPELMSFGELGRMNLNVLKRFSDGTYYEDFFVDKITKALIDYNFDGLHVSDFFCPPEHTISEGDFSTDLLEQFAEITGVKFPENIQARLGYDDIEDIRTRKEYIWENLRREWIDFYSQRWFRFWHKICTALKKIDKKVMINNAWCADPIEALYRYGIDYKRFIEAGVDYIVCETVAEGMELINRLEGSYNKFMTMSQIISAYIPPENQISLLGVKDSTEEWNVINHATPRLERDIYALSSLYLQTDKLIRSNPSLMVCLGDGLTTDEWNIINERMDKGYSLNPKKVYGTSIVWSDDAVSPFIDEYIKTRRASLQQLIYKLKDSGTSFGTIIKPDNLSNADTTLFAANIDTMPQSDRDAILSYTKAPVICTAIAGYNPEREPDFYIEDRYAQLKLCIFGYNTSDVDMDYIEEIFKNNPETIEPQEYYDHPFFTTPMPFADMSKAFIKAMSYILQTADVSPFKADVMTNVMQLSDDTYRIYIYNPENYYNSYKVLANKKIADVKNITDFPIISPQLFVNRTYDEGDASKFGARYEAMHRYDPLPDKPDGFVAKLPPCGVSIFDVTLEK